MSRAQWFWGAAVAVAAVLIAGNYIVLTEHFGAGPPYYGRTTNMDKWTNPLPNMVVVDTCGLAVLGALVWLGRKAGTGHH